MKWFITGGAGFVGSAMIRFLMNETNHQVVNLDKLTYASNSDSVASVSGDTRYHFVQGDVCDRGVVKKILAKHKPDIIMHLAAESHVDRSIDDPAAFIWTNIVGTSVVLECAREYWQQLPNSRDGMDSFKLLTFSDGPTQESFRFHHISTDEVYGSLGSTGLFNEESAYDPSSPYSASKASSDHLVRAWHRTYGLPVLITHCSNNYGPWQFPEKFIPRIIIHALAGKPLPVYGDGQQIRDWLHVEDHARALYLIASQGKVGQTYNVGGNNERTNLEVVHAICEVLDELKPAQSSYKNLINLVADRPGHDRRYAIDASKIQNVLGWSPQETFETGLRKTINWYLDNLDQYQYAQVASYQRQGLRMSKLKYDRKL